jgi:hypothetical protein
VRTIASRFLSDKGITRVDCHHCIRVAARYNGAIMVERQRDTMKEILDTLDALRASAGNVMAGSYEPDVGEGQAEPIVGFLHNSILLCTERINAMREIVLEANRLRAQIEEEIDSLNQRRVAFAQTLGQLDHNQAQETLREARTLEIASVNRERGEFADMPVWEAARIVLQRAGRDLTTREIVDELRKGGKKMDGKATSKVSAALRQGKAADIFEARKISGSRQRWKLRESQKELFDEGEDTEN